jgi:hypothetical protein
VVPAFGLVGAAAVTTVTEVLRLFLALRFAAAEGFRTPQLARFVRPAVAAAGMIPALILAGPRPFLVLVAIGAAAYATLLLLLGVLKLDRPFHVRVVV